MDAPENTPNVVLPQSALTPTQLWEKRRVKVAFTGRRHVNSPLSQQIFDIEVTARSDNSTLSSILGDAVDAISELALFPTDLIEGVTFRFVSKPGQGHFKPPI